MTKVRRLEATEQLGEDTTAVQAAHSKLDHEPGCGPWLI